MASSLVLAPSVSMRWACRAFACSRAFASSAAAGAVKSPSESGLRYEVIERAGSRVGLITLSRRPVNALGGGLVAAFENVLGRIEASIDTPAGGESAPAVDGPPRCVVVASEVPGVFCAGADLKERKSMTESETTAFVSRLRALMQRIADLRVPTLAAVDGAALGGGLELAMACDIRVVGERARLALPECKLGIIPGAGGTQRMQRIVGKSMAKLLTFTGRQIDGREAYRIGLADDLVHCSQDRGTDDDGGHGGNAKESLVIERAMSIADEIARNGPLALASAKAAIEAGSTVSGMRQALDIEGFHYDKVLRSEDRLIALEAFSKKQTPVFTGR